MAGIALVKQAVKLGETSSAAATTHQTVAFASHLGASRPGSSKLDDKEAPLPAMLTAVSGMLSGESMDAARGEMPAKPVAPA
ncbi:hypothetical protein HD842_004798, partial [Massilia aurea]|nr:hypothetical protein [Massilia aurea]